MGVASAWAVQSAADMRSVCRLSLSSSLKCWAVVPVGFLAAPAHRENQIPAAPERARNAMGVQHVRHDTSAAAAVPSAHRTVCRASDRGGVRSSGRRRRFHAKFLACLLCGIRAAPTAFSRDGGLQWPWQPSVLVQNSGAEADQCGLFPTSESGVRARGFPVATYGGAASLWLELSDTNNMFGQ
ncbi:hypothetical protein TcCL_NonESM12543 [Trypanosoma cruzi]|nr:hypothetical protein TcCL_NonESM12543 [Trypanosoma cruzi]